jgi:O-antigen chain-terminating methyltransferase
VPSAAPIGAGDQARPSDTLEDWYLAFEDQFRGSREETKRAQEIYLDYVAAAEAGTASAPILDIGCGRGEWLELLMEHGSVARGVDLNQAMVLDNRRRGLDVTERDVIAYLAELPGASLGMVTGFHIIEHLRFDLLVTLFDECRRVLRPGGCILFETPNPENLVVGAYTFYFDPTHRHPLPPQLIEFVVRERGYADVEILRLHPREEAGSDQALLDKWFRGPTDYAVIGWKDHKGPLPR